MKIDKIVVGDYQTNCYVLTLNNNCIIIDPGDDYEKIQEKVGNKNIEAIIITHYHFDHVGALNNFKSKIIDYKYKDGFYKINDFEFNIIHTPGHKEDCITIYFEKEKMAFSDGADIGYDASWLWQYTAEAQDRGNGKRGERSFRGADGKDRKDSASGSFYPPVCKPGHYLYRR